MTEYSSYIQYYLYIIAFFFFVLIFKFGLKKQLSYIKVIIAGFIIAISIDIFLVIYYQLFSLEAYAFLIGMIFGDSIICVIMFLILYFISKSIYDWVKRKRRKEIEQK
jgi:predicted neutral ceramidase superfamily lipid hydrolase